MSEVVGAAGLYDALAPIYDAWQASDGMTPFSLVALAKLHPTLVSARAGVRSFLDLGCGTGALLHELRTRHPDWRLAGVDGSQGMLAVAARAAPGAGITWARAPLTGPLPLGGTFDAAGAFYDALNHLPDTAALTRAFASAAGALRPGGLLIFDLTNELGFDRWWRSRTEWWGVGWKLLVTTTYDPAQRLGRATVDLEHGGRESQFELLERCFSADEIRAALAAAGLAVEKVEPWSPFAIDAPGKTWWIARKTTG